MCFFLFINSFLSAQNPFPYQRDWGTYFGPYNAKSIGSVSDDEGNVYVLARVHASQGESEANSFITTGMQAYSGGDSDVFLFKFDSDGQLSWATFYGGEGEETPVAIKKDHNNNIYITGWTDSETGISTPGAAQENIVEQGQIAIAPYTSSFIAKFSPDGQLTWATYFDGELMDAVSDLGVGQNSLVIVGSTNSSTNISTTGSYQEVAVFDDQVNDLTGFIAKYDLDGNELWATYYGTDTGISIGNVTHCGIDSSGNIFVSGATNDDSGFYVSSSAYQPQNNGGQDLFLSKFSPSGNTRQWSTYFGGPADERTVNSQYDFIALRQDIYLTGMTKSTSGIATPGAYQENLNGDQSPLLVKFDGISGQLDWATYYGSTEIGYHTTLSAHLSINASHTEVWLSGSSSSTEDIATEDTYQEELNSTGNPDGYFAKFNTDGSIDFASYYGGDNDDDIVKVLPQNNGVFYLVGTTDSENAIVTQDAYQLELTGTNNIGKDPFIVKFIPDALNTQKNTATPFKVFPNPTAGRFTVLGGSGQILQLTVYDIQGRKIEGFSNVQTGRTFNMKGKLAPGLYFIKIQTSNEKIQSLKILVK